MRRALVLAAVLGLTACAGDAEEACTSACPTLAGEALQACTSAWETCYAVGLPDTCGGTVLANVTAACGTDDTDTQGDSDTDGT